MLALSLRITLELPKLVEVTAQVVTPETSKRVPILRPNHIRLCPRFASRRIANFVLILQDVRDFRW